MTGHADAGDVIFGAVIGESLGDDVRVTVIATGLPGGARPRHAGAPSRGGDDRPSETPAPSFDRALAARETEIDVSSFLRD